ncbi:hypothetical protein XK97_06075 [Obesumbacterium proteus]|uniref:DUF4435 domain-containing protein n=1 Tax=Obesumbacterium proteus TaxID=82983 RepID=UPI000621CEB0|nr:DUF4435 domain-containing protein [Obesumbacterium proteus]KKI47943.1 hypothetical protein XK97_06075 [Obesumbacterium proteus]
MSFLDRMQSAVESSQTALHIYLLKLSTDHYKLHVYYEGKCDNMLYEGMLRRVIRTDVELRTVICKNKKSVYKFRKELEGRSNSKNIIIYFVDKDIDDFSIKPYEKYQDIHETEFYSIENYVSSFEILQELCNVTYGISPDWEVKDGFYNGLKKTFYEKEKHFVNYFREIMVLAIYFRRKGIKPALSNIDYNDLISIDDNLNVIEKVPFEDIRGYFLSKVGLDDEIYDEECTKIDDILSTIDFRCYVRGKYHLSFFCDFANKIKNKAAANLAHKQRGQVFDEAIFLFAGPRISIPKSIIDFLASNAKNIMVH